MTEELSFIRDSLTQMLENDRQEDELIKVRQNFNSINDIRQAAIRYARRHKFAVSTLRSGARQLVLVCKHSGAYRATKSKTAMPNDSQLATPEEPSNEAQAPAEATAAVAAAAVDPSTTTQEAASTSSSKKNTRKKLSQKIQCPFEIRAKPMGSSWIIYKVNYEHNHEMATDIKAYAQHRKLSPETKQLIIDLMNSGSTNSTIMEYLQLKGIDNVLKKDIANIRQAHFNNKSKKGNQTQKPQQFLYVKAPQSSLPTADPSGTFQSALQNTIEDSKPDLSNCAATHSAAALESATTAAATNSMDPSSTANANMTTDATTTNQPQQKNESTTTEGEQLYQFISQNNVQVN
ncbi:hypothetical protein MAM1_0027c02193 [Mucor ambiguus]|uniref:FAR1 domain-containing protein n=1 Tax=Mucor ambiguus TaxID=91626 RepID=A0A0C9M272_9FUNG|nr:hypothetical protein MAM1_0027c02193 [Mucor ambiguus]